jgi:glycosyltransferase involved in cell wall biosynthesis
MVAREHAAVSEQARSRVNVVIPCRGCDASLATVVEGVAQALAPVATEVDFLLVADHSAADWAVIEALAARRRDVRGLSLQQRAGQHGAIAAGLDHADGDLVLVMDGDQQHEPSDAMRLIQTLNDNDNDIDVVIGQRLSRSESALLRLGSRGFFLLLSWMLGQRINPGLSTFSALKTSVLLGRARGKLRARHHLIEAHQQGARFATLAVAFPPRPRGASAYSLPRRVATALSIWWVARPWRWRRQPRRLLRVTLSWTVGALFLVASLAVFLVLAVGALRTCAAACFAH